MTYELLQRLQIRLLHILFGTTTYVHKNLPLNKVSPESNPGRKRYFRTDVPCEALSVGCYFCFD